jgi:predicted GIY-YIG superfamily endonuclease
VPKIGQNTPRFVELRSEAEAMWRVYILLCGDGTLYTGVTNDLDRRLAAHASGRGARYTRGRGPFRVVVVEEAASRGDALRRELAIKRMSRRQKLRLQGGRGGASGP